MSTRSPETTAPSVRSLRVARRRIGAGYPERPFRRIALVATLLGLPLLAPAPPSGAQDRSFAEATEVTVVEVPVQVVRRGEPVRGLRAEDFRIFDEGEPREISSFEAIDLASEPSEALPERAGASEPSPVPAPAAALAEGTAARRHLLLFFDLAFSRLEDLVRAERAARELVEERLHPSDLVGVSFYSPRRGLDLTLRFTSDHDQVLAVLEAFRALLEDEPAPGSKRGAAPRAAGLRRVDPLGLTAGASGAVLADVGRTQGKQRLLTEEALAWAGPFEDRSGMSLELNKLLNTIWHQQQQVQDRRSADIAELADALSAIGRATRGIAGPKHLVLFSRGFDVELLHVKTHGDSPYRGPEDSWFATGGGSWILRQVDEALEELRRTGWSIQAVEMAGTTAGWNWNFREGLFLLAEETGGALYENTNDPGVALEEMMERTAVTYLLSFQVSDLPEEPELRRLRVEVDGLPRGAQVVHRAAYERPKSWSELPPARRRAESAEALLAGDDRDNLGVQVLALPHRNTAGGWSVPVALELDGLSLLAGDLERTPGAEIYVYAFDSDGGVVDLVAHRIDFRKAEARGRLTERGLKFLADLSLPGGDRYRLRFLVHSLRNGETALRTLPIELPERDARSVLLPPLLLESEIGSWVVTTEVEAGPGASRRPFTLHGRAVTPAVRAVRDPDGGRVLILGYGLGDVAGSLRVTLLGKDGNPAGEARFLARAPSDGSEPDMVVASLPAGLAPGDYTLEVSLTGEDGTVRGRTATALRIEETIESGG